MIAELHVAWAAPMASQLLASGAWLDREDTVGRLSDRLAQAAEIIHSWVLQAGGTKVSDICTQGAFKVPADRIHDLGRIIEQVRLYVETEYYFGVGLGVKEAHEAMRQAYRSQEPYAFYDETAGATDADEDDPKRLDEALNDNPLEKAVNDGHDHWMPAEKSQNEAQADGGPQNPDGVAQPDAGSASPQGGPQEAAPADDGSSSSSGSESSDGQEEQGQQDQGDPMTIVAKALLKIKEQAAAIHTLKDKNPEAFEAVRNLVQAMVALGHQVKEQAPQPEEGGEKTEKAEVGVFKALKAPKLGTRKQIHMKYPDALPSPASEAGTIKDGKIKVAPVDPADGSPRPQGWNQARSGMIVGPKGSAVSSREPNTE